MDDYDAKLREYLIQIGGLDLVSERYMELHRKEKFLKRLMFLHDFIDHLSLEELQCVEARMMVRKQELSENSDEYDPNSKTDRNS